MRRFYHEAKNVGYRIFDWIMHCVAWYYGVRFNVFLRCDFMKRIDYEKMIDDAIEEFNGMDINYAGMLTCLKGNSQRKYDYVPIREVVKAKERIDTLKRLKNLDLLK